MANVLEAICDIWALRQFAVRDIGLPAYKDEIMRLIDASLRIEPDGAGWRWQTWHLYPAPPGGTVVYTTSRWRP